MGQAVLALPIWAWPRQSPPQNQGQSPRLVVSQRHSPPMFLPPLPSQQPQSLLPTGAGTKCAVAALRRVRPAHSSASPALLRTLHDRACLSRFVQRQSCRGQPEPPPPGSSACCCCCRCSRSCWSCQHVPWWGLFLGRVDQTVAKGA